MWADGSPVYPNAKNYSSWFLPCYTYYKELNGTVGLSKFSRRKWNLFDCAASVIRCEYVICSLLP